MNELHLYERLTHQYRPGWRYLDDEEYRGTAKILKLQLVEDNGIDGHQHKTRVIVPSNLANEDLTSVIEDTLNQSTCQHEHDCCGCASTYATAKRVSKREYAVRLFTSYNV